MRGYLCGPSVYAYDGWTFEIHSYSGPWPVRKDGELYKYASKRFWNMWERFSALSKEEKDACLVFEGGCRWVE